MVHQWLLTGMKLLIPVHVYCCEGFQELTLEADAAMQLEMEPV